MRVCVLLLSIMTIVLAQVGTQCDAPFSQTNVKPCSWAALPEHTIPIVLARSHIQGEVETIPLSDLYPTNHEYVYKAKASENFSCHGQAKYGCAGGSNTGFTHKNLWSSSNSCWPPTFGMPNPVS